MLRFKRFASSVKYNQAKVLRQYPVGAIYHGYEIKRVFPIKDLQIVAVDLEHAQTGSQHLHLHRDDTNNVFSLVFKTNPPDHTGVPHILEHTTLCGSQQFPVRDPFFKMLNRSLANFMNAMTAHDYTYYPFATTNEKDFGNLMDIYIDSTLNPLLKYKDFCQEGWRLENEKIDDIKTPLVFKGVVYNEMKGQMSNLQYLFYTKFKQAIFPSLQNSGGDPLHITSLDHSDLVSFHSTNYHPSNMKTFTYGNNELNNTLLKLNESLKLYGKRIIQKESVKLPIALPQDSNIKVQELSPPDSMLPPDRQIKSSLTWILNNPNENLYDTFLLKILNVLLFDSTNSPFYKKLIESGIAYEFSCNTGLESMTTRNFMSVGLQGIDETFLNEKFESEILSILSNDCLNDMSLYSETKVQALVNQMELSLKNQQSQFGLTMLNHILPQWVNHGDPLEIINFNENIDTFKEEFAERGASIFTDLIKKYLIDKPYFHFTMTGDKTYNDILKSQEDEKLATKLNGLDEQDRKIIYDRNMLHSEENTKMKEDLSVLPSLQISDISTHGLDHKVDISEMKVYSRIASTNGISYLKFKKNIGSVIPIDLLPYMSLFTECLTTLGTKTQEFDEIEDEIKLHTGGVSITSYAQTSIHDLQNTEYSLELSGWSLNGQISYIWQIWLKLLNETDFSTAKLPKLITLIKSLSSNTSSSFSDSGHSYAKSYAAASFSKTFRISEELGGLKECQFINRLNSIIEDESKIQTEILDKLVRLQKILLNSFHNQQFVTGNPNNNDNNSSNNNDTKMFIVTDDSNQISKFASGVEIDFLTKLDKFDDNLINDLKLQCKTVQTDLSLLPGNNKTLIDFPFQVYHTAKVLKGVPYVHADGAKLQLLSTLMSNKILHSEIREKNGAYGGGCSFSAVDGLFSFYSYRDPNPLKSMELFDKLCDREESENFTSKFQWTEQDLNEAKLSIFQRLDAPVSPRSEGSSYFHYGIDYNMKEQRRHQLLTCTLSDVSQVKEKYLLREGGQEYAKAVVGDSQKTQEFAKKGYQIINPSLK